MIKIHGKDLLQGSLILALQFLHEFLAGNPARARSADLLSAASDATQNARREQDRLLLIHGRPEGKTRTIDIECFDSVEGYDACMKEFDALADSVRMEIPERFSATIPEVNLKKLDPVAFGILNRIAEIHVT